MGNSVESLLRESYSLNRVNKLFKKAARVFIPFGILCVATSVSKEQSYPCVLSVRKSQFANRLYFI